MIQEESYNSLAILAAQNDLDFGANLCYKSFFERLLAMLEAVEDYSWAVLVWN